MSKRSNMYLAFFFLLLTCPLPLAHFHFCSKYSIIDRASAHRFGGKGGAVCGDGLCGRPAETNVMKSFMQEPNSELSIL